MISKELLSNNKLSRNLNRHSQSFARRDNRRTKAPVASGDLVILTQRRHHFVRVGGVMNVAPSKRVIR